MAIDIYVLDEQTSVSVTNQTMIIRETEAGEGCSEIYLRISEGFLQYSTDNVTWNNLATVQNGQDGEDGDDGIGIQSIAKTGTNGLVDTYTITFTNDTKTTFTVTNGKDGSNYVLTTADKEEIAGMVNVPVKSVNGKTGAVNLSASDVGARPNTWTPSASEVGAEASGTATSKVSEHNTSETSHNDIRLLIEGLTNKLNALSDSDDTTLDQMSEIVAYIKSNKSLIDAITTGKVSVSDIIDNLTTSVSNKPLSAKQGVALKALIDEVKTTLNNLVVPTKTSQLTNDSGFLTQHQDLSGYAPKATTLAGYGITDGATKGELGQVQEQIADYIGEEIPDYWQTHLDEKIPVIQALQNEGGKDCFSFVKIVDSHVCLQDGYEWKPISPLIAKKVMDACDIKYLLYGGDVNHRGCYNLKSQLERDNEYIYNVMFKPVIDRLLQELGNHDFNYGNLDRDGNGVISNSDNGTIKPVEERETYVYSFTDGEKHRQVFRKVGMVGDVHFDESGTGYWIDDVSNKVRYILLNTHNTKYELRDDGTQKYPPMWLFRFQQSQYDMVIEALTSIPSDDWYVVVAGHVPLDKSGEVEAWGGTNDDDSDCGLMKKLLKAYKNKTTFNGLFEGTAIGSGIVANFTNKVDLNSNDFLDGHYMSINGTNMSIAENDDFCLTNYIPAVCPNKVADLVRIKGHVTSSVDIRYACYDSNKNLLFAGASGTKPDFVTDENGVTSWNVGKVDDYISTANANALAFVRFSFKKATTIEDIIVTVNEEITYTESESTGGGYDAVSVDCDFTSAKGEIAGFFGGHVHVDNSWEDGINIISTRCDGIQENTDELRAERVVGTATEYSFDVFTVNKKTRKIHVTKIGAGSDREINII